MMEDLKDGGLSDECLSNGCLNYEDLNNKCQEIRLSLLTTES